MSVYKESISSWGLYVGGVREAGNQELLQTLGITAVVNAAPDVVHIEYPKHWRVLVVDAEDDPCYPLLETWPAGPFQELSRLFLAISMMIFH